MNNTLTATMPSATGALFISRNTLPLLSLRSCFIAGRLSSSHRAARVATGTTQKNAPRQPISAPTKLPSGAAITVARALPPLTMARARGTWSAPTRRMAVAADSDQKPPIATPINARPAMNVT
ncbi:hypothetical protein D3C80_1321100 [compost metagenome]